MRHCRAYGQGVCIIRCCPNFAVKKSAKQQATRQRSSFRPQNNTICATMVWFRWLQMLTAALFPSVLLLLPNA